MGQCHVVPRAYRSSQCLAIGKWPIAESGLHGVNIGVSVDRSDSLAIWGAVTQEAPSRLLGVRGLLGYGALGKFGLLNRVFHSGAIRPKIATACKY